MIFFDDNRHIEIEEEGGAFHEKTEDELYKEGVF